jgi:uncharacterized protein (DUF1800 family)
VGQVPAYTKPFGVSQAERLLWRAGFGPRPGEAEKLSKLGLNGAVDSLLDPPAFTATGPAPTDRGYPIAPNDANGHDHLWWLDRMVRGNQPLIERMTLIWHDWFATSLQKVGSQTLMLNQNQTLRTGALGSFQDLLLNVTVDPAMLIWLDGVQNTKRSPNENYGREMMELFTLGWSNGYTETDVREQARSLTGWRAQLIKGVGPTNFQYVPQAHDDGAKTVFGKSGDFDWHDSCKLCVQHPYHAAYFVQNLWSYFVPTPPDKATLAGLQSLYGAGTSIEPVVSAILRHPDLYEGPRMVKQPVVYTAGLLRALGQGVNGRIWTQLGEQAGQRLFLPPDVAGWDYARWLDTATFRARWFLAANALAPLRLDERSAGEAVKPAVHLQRAQHLFGNAQLSPKTQHAILSFTSAAAAVANVNVVQNSVRQLVAVSPDLQTA